MFTADWKNRFIELAMLVSSWSKDPSTKVGTVIVDPMRRVISLGYNGFPRHVDDDMERYNNKSIKYAMIVHAEANAILNARTSLDGKILISTKMPCSACTQLIIQSGIDTVISPPADSAGKWADDSMLAKQMMAEAGVTIEIAQLPRHGVSIEDYHVDGLRHVGKCLEPVHDEACNRVMNVHVLNCGCKKADVESAQDAISRLLRGKSI